jgi:uncharacterized membrane protein (GlpM family)
MFFVFLAIKAFFAGGIVLAMSLLAERLSPRVAGIVSGAPLGGLISYYILGLEEGIPFVVASIPHAVAGMSGVMVFIAVYHEVARLGGRFQVLKSCAASLAAQLAVSTVLSRIHFDLLGALVLAVAIALLAGLALRRALDVKVATPVRLTLRLLTLRAGLAAAMVLSVVGMASVLGPAWAGVLMGFPMTLLPTMLIVNVTYSADHVNALLKGFPIGIGSVICYVASLPWSYPAFGVHMGTLVSLLVAWGYLVAVSLVFFALRHRR